MSTPAQQDPYLSELWTHDGLLLEAFVSNLKATVKFYPAEQLRTAIQAQLSHFETCYGRLSRADWLLDVLVENLGAPSARRMAALYSIDAYLNALEVLVDVCKLWTQETIHDRYQDLRSIRIAAASAMQGPDAHARLLLIERVWGQLQLQYPSAQPPQAQ